MGKILCVKKMAIALRHQAMKILYKTYLRCYSPFYCPEVFASAYLHWSVKQQIGDFKPSPFYFKKRLLIIASQWFCIDLNCSLFYVLEMFNRLLVLKNVIKLIMYTMF